jgi:transposase
MRLLVYNDYMTIKIKDPHIAFILQDEIRRSEESRYDHRLHAVLLVAKGMSCPEASDYLGDPERTLRQWISQYIKDGLQGLVENEHPGRPTKLTSPQMEQINHVLRGKPEKAGLKGAIWDGKLLSAFIQKEFGITLGIRQCQRMFRQLGFRMRKPRPMIAHANPEVQDVFKKSPKMDRR